MESSFRKDSWRSVKKRVLEGHKAMTSLGEDDEDTPYPAPRPITGLPEPISREVLKGVFYLDSGSEQSSEVEFDMGVKCNQTTLKSGSRMSNILGFPEPIPSEVFRDVFYSESGSESCSEAESEMDEKDTQTTLKSGTKMDNTSEPSMKGVRRDIRNYIHTLHSTIVDLHLKNQHLYRDNSNIHSKYDDCLKRNGILQGRAETSRKEAEFFRKILECSKYRGENGFITVLDLKNEKRVQFCNGKKEYGDSPLLDPAVKAQVDKRLEPITRPRSDDENDKEEMICKTIPDKETVFYTMDVHKRYLKECMVAKMEKPSIKLTGVSRGMVDDINGKDNGSKTLGIVTKNETRTKEKIYSTMDTKRIFHDKENLKECTAVKVDKQSVKLNEGVRKDMVDNINGENNERKTLDMIDNGEDNVSEKLKMVKKNTSKLRAYNMEAIYLYNMIDNDTYSYNIADGYLT